MEGHHRDELAERIVDAALFEAEATGGWHHVSLCRVADSLGVGMVEIGRRFRDKDAVADAWFDRARLSTLAAVDPDLARQPVRERLIILFCRWFDTLAPHREVTVQMVQEKMWPFHPHHWVPLVFNLSRTILWIRDAAGMRATSPRGEMEEIGLTWLFLAAFAVWSCDRTPDQERTRRFLRQRLTEADSLMVLLFGEEQCDADAAFASSDSA
jgi:AcrR family transcriptional regulator